MDGLESGTELLAPVRDGQLDRRGAAWEWGGSSPRGVSLLGTRARRSTPLLCLYSCVRREGERGSVAWTAVHAFLASLASVGRAFRVRPTVDHRIEEGASLVSI